MKKKFRGNYKETVGKSQVHAWLRAHYGSQDRCDNKNCSGKSKTFDWCKKTGKEYLRKKENFIRLCRSCHRAYDMTPEKKEQSIKNLIWYDEYNPDKIVVKYNKKMEVVAEYSSVKEASIKNNVHFTLIYSALSGKAKTCRKHIWKYKNGK